MLSSFNFNCTLIRYVVSAIVTLCTLNGCGFYLRGSHNAAYPLAFKRLFIASSELSSLLQERLSLRHDLDIVAHPEQAEAVLRIDKAIFDRQTLAVGRSGQVSEYQLIYRVHFSLLYQGQAVNLSNNEITVVREYSFDTNKILGKEEEASLLQKEMQQDAAQQIIYRLSALKKEQLLSSLPTQP